jgi:tetratricopeptide (TPR) repeat protein
VHIGGTLWVVFPSAWRAFRQKGPRVVACGVIAILLSAALFYAGAAYLYSGRFEMGVRCFERSLERNPNQPDVLMHLGLTQGYLGDFTRAHEYFARAERMAPTGGMSLAFAWYRAIVLVFEVRHEVAVVVLEGCMQQMPRYATARVTLGLAYQGLGRVDDAKATIEKAARLEPGLSVDGIALNIGTHPDPEKGLERVALLREYWPGA